MAIEDMRPPACGRCGIVESVRMYGRHRCHPTSVLMMQVGPERAVRIGLAVVRAFGLLR